MRACDKIRTRTATPNGVGGRVVKTQSKKKKIELDALRQEQRGGGQTAREITSVFLARQ